MSKYYYRFPAESPEGKQLRSYHRAAQKAEREAQQYGKKVGAATYYEDPNCFAGGVVAVTAGYQALVNFATNLGGPPLASFAISTGILAGACGSGSGGTGSSSGSGSISRRSMSMNPR